MRLEEVREQLSGYQAADATEANYVTRMIALTLATRACERLHFVPGHFTASAFVLSPDRRDLILIHHKKLGIWLQPGGHVEATDADLASAARREVAEEVGLGELDSFAKDNALFDVDIHTIPARKSEPAHEHFDARFAFVARTRDFARTEEVADVRWVPLDRVSEATADESVLRAARKLLAADRSRAFRQRRGGRTLRARTGPSRSARRSGRRFPLRAATGALAVRQLRDRTCVRSALS